MSVLNPAVSLVPSTVRAQHPLLWKPRCQSPAWLSAGEDMKRRGKGSWDKRGQQF